jgi:hypothetical protein
MNDKIKEKILELKELVWLQDIQYPTIPEYREHHESIQKILKFIDDELIDIDKYLKVKLTKTVYYVDIDYYKKINDNIHQYVPHKYYIWERSFIVDLNDEEFLNFYDSEINNNYLVVSEYENGRDYTNISKSLTYKSYDECYKACEHINIFTTNEKRKLLTYRDIVKYCDMLRNENIIGDKI